jgi:hypothetical protein
MARRRQFVTGNPKLNDPLLCARLVPNSGMKPFLHAFHNRSTCFATENSEFRGTPSVELCPSTYLYDASVNARSTLKPSRTRHDFSCALPETLITQLLGQFIE